MNTSSVHERVRTLIEKLGLNNHSFSQALGGPGEKATNSSVIANIVGGRMGKPSFQLLERVAEAFPQVNFNWLVTGAGSVFQEEAETIVGSDCWELVEKERLRARQLQADYDELLGRYTTLRRTGESGV